MALQEKYTLCFFNGETEKCCNKGINEIWGYGDLLFEIIYTNVSSSKFNVDTIYKRENKTGLLKNKVNK